MFWGPLAFSTLINDFTLQLITLGIVFFADIKIFRASKSPNDSKLLQSENDSVQDWRIANFMKLSNNEKELYISQEKLVI